MPKQGLYTEMLRVAVLALSLSGLSAFDGSADAPIPCCFTLGFASNQLPCCLEVQKLESVTDPDTGVTTTAKCTLKAPLGGTLGFNNTFCPSSADEAQCIVQSSPIIPTDKKLSIKKAGPECAFLDAPKEDVPKESDGSEKGEEGEEGEEGEAAATPPLAVDSDDDRIKDPPIAPVKSTTSKKPKTVQPLINSDALRLRPRTLQPSLNSN